MSIAGTGKCGPLGGGPGTLIGPEMGTSVRGRCSSSSILLRLSIVKSRSVTLIPAGPPGDELCGGTT